MAAEFRMTRRVLFSETDMAGVMHFSNYLRWLEDAEHAFWRSLGLSVHSVVGPQHFGWPRVAVSCEYAEPIRFEDEVELRLRVTRIGEKSLDFQVDFHCGGRRAAVARTTTVYCRVEPGGRFTPVPIPDWLRSRLEPHVQT
jgi:acyl-CoA thioester hydrolase